MRWWRNWVDLLSIKEPGSALALFRIAFGAVLFLTLVDCWTSGVWELIWIDKADGGYRNLGTGNHLVAWLGGPTPEVVGRLYSAALFFSALLALGIGGRVTALLAGQTFMGLVHLNPHAGGSYDELFTNGCWLLVLADSTRTLSLDCLLRTGKWTSPEPVSAWPRYLVIFQIMVCYWTTGVQKLSAYWTPGGDFSALYYILQQPSWQRADMQWVAYVFPLTQLGTAVTWLWEVLVPLWLLAFWYRYTSDRPGRVRAWFNRWDVRSWFVAVGLLFHVLVHIFMNVGPFSYVSAAYLLAMYTPAEYGRLWERVVAATSRSPESSPTAR